MKREHKKITTSDLVSFRRDVMFSRLKNQDCQKGIVADRISSNFYPYPINTFLAFEADFDFNETSYHEHYLPEYHPAKVAKYTLFHWNLYLTTHDIQHYEVFLTGSQWLIDHKIYIDENVCGWLHEHMDAGAENTSFSASTQGSVLSVLMRAYQATLNEEFLVVARQAVAICERDIFDDGIASPVGVDGVFFEENASYPASHMLSGFCVALIGLYDYVAVTGDEQVNKIIQRGIATLHTCLKEFDTGFWTRADLLHRQLATPAQHALHVELLEALASYSSCEHCLALALRWKSYQHKAGIRLRYELMKRLSVYNNAFWKQIRSLFFQRPDTAHNAQKTRVCVPINAFPVTGGMRAVLNGVTQVTADIWGIEYLTQYIGVDADDYTIHKFGIKATAPWQFPTVWLYSLAGLGKLLSLMHSGAKYQVILPQDGVFTGAFAALAAKIAGARVVCIDHGNLTLLNNPSYRTERITTLASKGWSKPRYLFARLRLVWYWPSLSLLAKISARLVDHFLIPGVVGDGTEDICAGLGIPGSRITRFGSMIDTSHYIPLEAKARLQTRAKFGISADAIVIAMTCRLAPEKGIGIALEAISRLMHEVSQEVSMRIRIIIAGDGPLREHVEDTMRSHGLEQICLLWGETASTDVISLLGMSDIFLYTSIRGACLSMAVLEAMASGCAVIASTRPLSNAHLLAEERGIAIDAENVDQTSDAIIRLVNDPELCLRMGQAARAYTEKYHSAALFRKTLLRATYWSKAGEHSR
jgi:glycosyltransferase involved in cell wall biosynthesis